MNYPPQHNTDHRAKVETQGIMSESTQLLNHAKKAIREKDHEKAWRLLHQYISIQPEDVDAWLMLGGLAKPSARIAYLSRAETLAPDDDRVQRAIEWAMESDRQVKTDEQVTEPIKNVREKIYQKPVDHQLSDVPMPTIGQQKRKKPAKKGRHAVKRENQQQASMQAELPSQLDEESVEHKETPKGLKWLKTAGTVLVIAVFVVLLGIGVSARISGREPSVFGYQMMIVTSGSMEPIFNTGSLIVINIKADQDYQVGDVIMFQSAEDPDRNVTHRIINIHEENGEVLYQTQGDNNDAADMTQITRDHIRGKYINITVPLLGYFFSFIKSRNGILLMIALLGLYLVVSQGLRIRQMMKEEA